MSTPLIVDSSPIICLAKSGYIELLTGSRFEIVVPSLVAEEISNGGSEDAASIWICSEPDVSFVSCEELQSEALSVQLGRGETCAISIALRRQSENPIVMFDDYQARKAARALNLRCIGTLRFLLDCKEQKLIDKIEPILKALVNSGLYISDSLRDEVLSLAGE